MKTPLTEYKIECSECKEDITLQEVNDDVCRMYDEKGRARTFPKDGVDESTISTIESINWICEVCKEDQDE